MSSDEKLSRTGQKNKKYWYKIFLLKDIVRLEYEKIASGNYICS